MSESLSIKEVELPIRIIFLEPIMKNFGEPFVFDDVTIMENLEMPFVFPYLRHQSEQFELVLENVVELVFDSWRTQGIVR